MPKDFLQGASLTPTFEALMVKFGGKIGTSKHLKGQLDPPVSDGNVFWTKGGQLDPPMSDVTFFGPKEVGFHVFLR